MAAVVDGRATVWDLSTQSTLFQDKSGGSRIARLSPDGKTLAVTNTTEMAGSTKVKLWDTDTSQLIKILRPMKGNADAIRFSPVRNRLLMCGHSTSSGWVNEKPNVRRDVGSPNLQDSLMLWDIDAGNVVRKFPLPGYRSFVRVANDCMASPDGKYLIYGRTVWRVIDLRIGDREAACQEATPYNGNDWSCSLGRWQAAAHCQ